MTKEELKAMGLSDEQADKIFEDYGKNYVPKSQFNEKLEALKHEKEEKDKAAKELDSLKKQHEGDEDLKKQIEDLQQAAKDREKNTLPIWIRSSWTRPSRRRSPAQRCGA